MRDRGGQRKVVVVDSVPAGEGAGEVEQGGAGTNNQGSGGRGQESVSS